MTIEINSIHGIIVVIAILAFIAPSTFKAIFKKSLKNWVSSLIGRIGKGNSND